MSQNEERYAALAKDYEEKKERYEKFCNFIKTKLQELLANQSGITITHRVKTWDSIEGKLQRRGNIDNGLDGINDIAGVRVIVLFKPELEKVIKMLDKYFINKYVMLIEKYDTSKHLEGDHFGYSSTHYNVIIPEHMGWGGLDGFKAEIQVRTAAQHVWAEASHELQYKQEEDVPLDLRRSINRVAAILELADLEFTRIISEKREYVLKSQKEESVTANQPLNADLLKMILKNLLPPENFVDNDFYSDLLSDLRANKILTPHQLKNLIKDSLDDLKKEDKQAVIFAKEGMKNGLPPGTTALRILEGVYFTHVGLVRAALRKKFGTKQSPSAEQIKQPTEKN